MDRNTIKMLMCAFVCSLQAGVAWADGAVYAMTNALGNNQVLVYYRLNNGNLSPWPIQTIATGGGGSGLQLSASDSLGSAGSIQLDAGHHFLFVVNTETAMSNNGAGAYNTDCNQGTITSFLVGSDGSLTFVDRVFSRGLFPHSLTVTPRTEGGDLLYVLNAGGPEPPAVCSEEPAIAGQPNITGFKVNKAGYMEPIGSVRAIDPGPSAPADDIGENCPDAAGFAAFTGAPAADFNCGLNPPSFPRSPSQVRFTPDGNQLIVTDKGINTIYVFPVNAAGKVGSPTITQASLPALPTYFGFTFDNSGHLLVAEAFGAATSLPAGAAGAVSSFDVTNAGDLESISSHVGDQGTAACWIALEPINGKYVYVSNNLSASISGYSVTHDGKVTLVNGTAATPSGPNDLVAVQEGNASFLYVITAGGSGTMVGATVGAFQINLTNGSLTAISGGLFPINPLFTPFPEGIAAY
jgi:6-phosphogluconolactonase (cycloisomerase 2 family)